MKIGIDVDNVVNNLTECVIKVYNEDSDDKLSIGDITTYGLEHFVKAQYKDRIKHYFEDARVWRQISVTDGAREYISKLFNEGNEIYFCTKTTPRNVPKKFSWLQRNFPFLDIGKCTFLSPEKGMIKFDVLVDDAPENCMHKDRDYVSLVMNQPWNQGIESNKEPQIIRCYNWKDIYQNINCIKPTLRRPSSSFCMLCKCNNCFINTTVGGARECGNCYECGIEGHHFKDHCSDYRETVII